MKKLTILTLLLSLGLIYSCGKQKYDKGETETSTINVVVNSGTTYDYDFGILADEKKAVIYQHATHASTSTLGKLSGSSNTEFTYTPLDTYSGSDEVRVKIYEDGDEKGSGGNGHCGNDQSDSETEIYIFKITVNKSNN